MNRIKNLACGMLCVMTPIFAVGGQDSSDKKAATLQQQTEQPVEKQQTLDPSVQKILLILNQVLETQKGFADSNLRIAIRVQVADMLWAYDEPRARRLFEEALEALAAAHLAERTAATSSLYPSAGFMNLAYRSVQMVIRRDPALAAKLGESLVDIPPNPGQRSPGPNGDLRFVLASLLSFEDPQRAAQAAKPFAERGDLSKLIPVIRVMRRKDAKAADELFFQVFGKVRLGDPSADDIRLLASYVFPDFGEGVIIFTSGGGGRDTDKPILLSRAVVEQFLDLAYNTIPVRLEEALANAQTDRSFFPFPRDYAIARLLAAQFDLSMPDRAAAFRIRVEEVRRRVPLDQQHKMAVNEPGTVSELVARAAALSNPAEKDSLYQKASEQAIMSGDMELASSLAEKIVSESVRAGQRERINDSSSFDEIQKAFPDG